MCPVRCVTHVSGPYPDIEPNRVVWQPIPIFTEAMDDISKELKDIQVTVGEQIHEDCYFKTLDLVRDLGSPELLDGSVPLEAWMGIAQAMADASGYRVVLEAAVMKERTTTPTYFRRSGMSRAQQQNQLCFPCPAKSRKVE